MLPLIRKHIAFGLDPKGFLTQIFLIAFYTFMIGNLINILPAFFCTVFASQFLISANDFIYEKNPAFYNFPINKKDYVLSVAVYEIIAVLTAVLIAALLTFFLKNLGGSYRYIYIANNVCIMLLMCAVSNALCPINRILSKFANLFTLILILVFLIIPNIGSNTPGQIPFLTSDANVSLFAVSFILFAASFLLMYLIMINKEF